jgi:hypothetical protein
MDTRTRQQSPTRVWTKAILEKFLEDYPDLGKPPVTRDLREGILEGVKTSLTMRVPGRAAVLADLLARYHLETLDPGAEIALALVLSGTNTNHVKDAHGALTAYPAPAFSPALGNHAATGRAGRTLRAICEPILAALLALGPPRLEMFLDFLTIDPDGRDGQQLFAAFQGHPDPWLVLGVTALLRFTRRLLSAGSFDRILCRELRWEEGVIDRLLQPDVPPDTLWGCFSWALASQEQELQRTVDPILSLRYPQGGGVMDLPVHGTEYRVEARVEGSPRPREAGREGHWGYVGTVWHPIDKLVLQSLVH